MAEVIRLDPHQNITAINWGAGSFFYPAIGHSLNPGTTEITRTGLFATFNAGTDPSDGGGLILPTPISGIRIDEFYFDSRLDIEHGAVDPDTKWVMVYGGAYADAHAGAFPPGLIEITGYFTFDTALGTPGIGTMQWTLPHAPSAAPFTNNGPPPIDVDVDTNTKYPFVWHPA